MTGAPAGEAIAARPATIDEVIAAMRVLEARLPAQDGVAWFNRLYLRVTERVAERLAAGGFRRPDRLERLDVVFAGLYFDALDAGHRAPAPWRELIDRRGRTDVAPIQFALAGMNAHIVYDLPIALVATREGSGPQPGEHDDFQAVNGILEAVEEEVKGWFAADYPFGHLLGRVEEALALWSVVDARDDAWATAGRLAADPDAAARERSVATLARAAGRLSARLLGA